MFARKYQRIAAEHSSQGAVFLEILGDESADTRVSCFPVCLAGLLEVWLPIKNTLQSCKLAPPF